MRSSWTRTGKLKIPGAIGKIVLEYWFRETRCQIKKFPTFFKSFPKSILSSLT